MYDPYNSLIPIFRETTIPKGINQIASAVYVKNQMGYFLFTAAHVTDDLSHSKLLVPANGFLAEIDGYVAFVDLLPEQRRDDDNIDVAYIKLSHKFSIAVSQHFEPICGRNSEVMENSSKLYTCSVAGYPASKGKKMSGSYSSDIFAFTGMNVTESIYNEYGLSTSTNIALRFDRKYAVNPDTGESFPTPGLSGVSGGGIFAWPPNKPFCCDWSERKLVGIFHTYKKRENLLIGSTLLPFLSALTLGHMKGFGAY